MAAFPISAMALLAAIVVITNTTLVSVTQKTREIGVRRALGAPRTQIMREIVAESMVVALAGGVAGTLLTGLAISALVARHQPRHRGARAARWRGRLARRRPAAWWRATTRRGARRASTSSPRCERNEAWPIGVHLEKGPGPFSTGRRCAGRRERGKPARWRSIRCAASRCDPSLAIAGIVIGIVTVVLVATVLVGVRNGIAGLFRELGTENVFAFHRNGDPYNPASDKDAQRKPLKAEYAAAIAADATAIRDAAAQIIVPPIIDGRPLLARAGGNETDTALLEGETAGLLRHHRHRVPGRPAVHGPREPIRRAGGGAGVVGGPRAVRRGVVGGQAVHAGGGHLLRGGRGGAAQGRLLRREPAGQRHLDSRPAPSPGGSRTRSSWCCTRAPSQASWRRPRPRWSSCCAGSAGCRRAPRTTSTSRRPSRSSRSSIRSASQIGLATFALAAVSLIIGGIGIANVMVISVTERTREIGTRIAIGARRRDVLWQFLIESALLSVAGGLVGVAISWGSASC